MVRGPARSAVLALLVPLGAALLTACGDDGPETIIDVAPYWTMTVSAQEWSGWTDAPPAEPTVESEGVIVGSPLTLPGLGDEVVVEVTEASEAGVTVRTDSEMAPATASGGSDHNSLADTFEVRADAPAEFSTPTLDAGVTYTVTIAQFPGDG